MPMQIRRWNWRRIKLKLTYPHSLKNKRKLKTVIPDSIEYKEREEYKLCGFQFDQYPTKIKTTFEEK